MTVQKAKILVIGCGSIGRRHVRLAAEVAETAVYDEDVEKVKAIANEEAITPFKDIQSALGWLPDGVIIATPTASHLEIAEVAIAESKSILIEKPISSSSQGVRAFLQKAKSNHCQVFVGCNMRFHPAISALRDNLSQIGKVLFAKAHYGNYLPNMRPNGDYKQLYCSHRDQGGGVIMDSVHEIDYLRWLFGPVIAASGHSEKISDLEIDVEDIAEIVLKHSTGLTSTIHVDYVRQRKSRGCEIIGNKGTLRWHSDGKSPEICQVSLFRTGKEDWETVFQDDNIDVDISYRRQRNAFLDAIKSGKNGNLLSGVEGANTLAVALAVRDNGSGSIVQKPEATW